MRKERRHGRSKGERGGKKRAEQGRSMEGRAIGREGNFKGGTLRRHWPVYSAQDNTQRGPCHCHLVLQIQNC